MAKEKIGFQSVLKAIEPVTDCDTGERGAIVWFGTLGKRESMKKLELLAYLIQDKGLKSFTLGERKK